MSQSVADLLRNLAAENEKADDRLEFIALIITMVAAAIALCVVGHLA